MQPEARITFRLPEAERRELIAAASRDKRTVSAALRVAAERYAQSLLADKSEAGS